MADPAQNDNKVVAAQAPTCPLLMLGGEPCGRPSLAANVLADRLCLMHAPTAKDEAAFGSEFEHILNEAGIGVADFSGFVFPSANYAGRRFEPFCVFSRATFVQDADFRDAEFARDVSFIGSAFAQRVGFWDTVFAGEATFAATFTGKAGFSGAVFRQNAEFAFSTFTKEAVFNGARFERVAGFSRTTFLGSVEFRETKFRADEERLPGPVFSLAEFSQPEAVVFYKTYLGQALFHNCDVSCLNFSSVEWRARRKGGKRAAFEEVVRLGDPKSAALRPKEGRPDERDYGLIAELYQQLKRNYDERGDYWAAGDFHYGEMEMKRLRSGSTSRLARWLYRNFGLVAWYRYASEYGESYVRPVVGLLIVLAVFMLLFPWAGLEKNEDSAHPAALVSQQALPAAAATEISYTHFDDFVRTYPGRKWFAPAAFFGNSLITVLSVAGFQKELKYEPSYPWGRALALLELLLTSTLIALFLLAVRRQFKR